MRKFKLILLSIGFVSILAPLILTALAMDPIIGGIAAIGGTLFLFGTLDEWWSNYRWQKYIINNHDQDEAY